MKDDEPVHTETEDLEYDPECGTYDLRIVSMQAVEPHLVVTNLIVQILNRDRIAVPALES